MFFYKKLVYKKRVRGRSKNWETLVRWFSTGAISPPRGRFEKVWYNIYLLMKLMKGSISREERGAFLKKFVELGAVRSKRLRSTALVLCSRQIKKQYNISLCKKEYINLLSLVNLHDFCIQRLKLVILVCLEIFCDYNLSNQKCSAFKPYEFRSRK